MSAQHFFSESSLTMCNTNQKNLLKKSVQTNFAEHYKEIVKKILLYSACLCYSFVTRLMADIAWIWHLTCDMTFDQICGKIILLAHHIFMQSFCKIVLHKDALKMWNLIATIFCIPWIPWIKLKCIRRDQANIQYKMLPYSYFRVGRGSIA